MRISLLVYHIVYQVSRPVWGISLGGGRHESGSTIQVLAILGSLRVGVGIGARRLGGGGARGGGQERGAANQGPPLLGRWGGGGGVGGWGAGEGGGGGGLTERSQFSWKR